MSLFSVGPQQPISQPVLDNRARRVNGRPEITVIPHRKTGPVCRSKQGFLGDDVYNARKYVDPVQQGLRATHNLDPLRGYGVGGTA